MRLLKPACPNPTNLTGNGFFNDIDRPLHTLADVQDNVAESSLLSIYLFQCWSQSVYIYAYICIPLFALSLSSLSLSLSQGSPQASLLSLSLSQALSGSLYLSLSLSFFFFSLRLSPFPAISLCLLLGSCSRSGMWTNHLSSKSTFSGHRSNQPEFDKKKMLCPTTAACHFLYLPSLSIWISLNLSLSQGLCVSQLSHSELSCLLSHLSKNLSPDSAQGNALSLCLSLKIRMALSLSLWHSLTPTISLCLLLSLGEGLGCGQTI